MVDSPPGRAPAVAGNPLILLGCGLFGVSVFLPVMRWDANPIHPTPGSARVFLGAGFTLVDGGFEGTSLIPVAVAAVVALAVVAVLGLLGVLVGPWIWWVQLGLAIVVAYYPLWILFVFLKKTEDEVDPAIGVVALVLAVGLIAAGLVRSARRDGLRLHR
jgi:hypothetical protein